MKFFIDTADVGEIRELSTTGLLDGVTTNPTLFARAGGDVFASLREICDLVSGPVSAEVTATDYDTMLTEGRVLARLANNIAVKVPLTMDGIKACRVLSEEGIMVNVTLCFSAAQALLAAKAGAEFISPFIGRLDDIGQSGMDLVADIIDIFSQFPDFRTQVLVASVRSTRHVVDAARLGADVVTLPPGVLRQLFHHPLTDKGLQSFLDDWKKTGQSILPVADDKPKAAE